MIRILFLIPNLGHGGAEKVLVNLVNHMNLEEFKITVMTLYDEGVNRASLSPYIEYKTCFRRSFVGVAHLLKLFSPEQLYKRLIHDHYDIVVSYLEGQTARIVSGCPDLKTKKICWIHRTMTSIEDSARLFRGIKEAIRCYSSFDKIVSVSKDVQDAFMNLYHLESKGVVAYNINQTEIILKMAEKPVPSEIFEPSEFKICAVGSLFPVKGFDRLLNVHRDLVNNGYHVHTYILGEGAEKKKLLNTAKQYGVENTFSLLGYQSNPYAYMKQCDLFVCSSRSEGFSTAATEALILGIPVVTTRVSGMNELLGENQRYGIVVDNDTEALYGSIKQLLDNSNLFEHYRIQAQIRGREFLTEKTVKAVQDVLIELWERA